MKTFIWTGVLLILFGAATLVIGQVSYTSEETIFEVGPVEATAETQESVAIPAAVGWVALSAGGVLSLVGLVGRMEDV